MNVVELPVVRTVEDISLGIKATHELYIPGFLIPPEVTDCVIGEGSIKEIAESLQPHKSPEVDPVIVSRLRPVLVGLMAMDIDNSEWFSAIQHNTTPTQGGSSHTDQLYRGGGLWLCGETKNNEPREFQMATVYSPTTPIRLDLEKVLPMYVKSLYKGIATAGWAAYFLSKSEPGNVNQPRTAHMVTGSGAWARFGEHDEEGWRVKRVDLQRKASLGL